MESALEKAFAAAAGFEVPTIVFTPAGAQRDRGRRRRARRATRGLLYVSLLKDAPTAAAVKKLDGAGKEGERAEVRGRAAHLLLGKDYHSAKLSNAVVEKHLGVATNRNVKVIRTLAEKWGAA